MNVAVVGYIGWYGSMAEWVADGWEANGHEVHKYDRSQLPNIPKDHDLYLFIDCSEDYSSNIPNINKPKVFWSMDAHMPGGAERSVNISVKCDLTFSSNLEHGVKRLQKFGIESVLLPITYSDKLAAKQVPDPEYDVVMIGHPNSRERKQLWDLLDSNFKCYIGRAETAQDYLEAMGSTKMVVNQPTEPWDIILNNRFFEAMACNTFLLQQRLKTTLIEDLGFKNHKHFVYWDSLGDIVGLVKGYLAFPDVRRKIAKDGNTLVQEYSMSNICGLMENVILNKFKEL